MERTEYLIDNVYIKLGNNVYRQTIDNIPMEQTERLSWQTCSCFNTIIYSYMKNLIRHNLFMAKWFSHTARYIVIY